MGETTLTINANVQGAVNGVNQVNSSLTSINQKVQQFQERAGIGFQDAAKSAKLLSKEMKEQEKIIKDMERQLDKYANSSKKLSSEQSRDFKRLPASIKEAKMELNGMQAAHTRATSAASMQSAALNNIKKIAGALGITFAATFAVGKIMGFVKESFNLAVAAEGIEMAFKKLNQPNLMMNMKEAVHGTVTEVELMKEAVKWNNFKLPMEKLPEALEFIKLRSQQTGQSMDQLMNILVRGLGRGTAKTLMGLGISMKDIKAAAAETGSVTEGVFKIMSEGVKSAGDYIETTKDKMLQWKVATEDFKTAWGKLIASGSSKNIIGKFTEGMDFMTFRMQEFQKQGGGFVEWWKRFLQIGEYSEEAWGYAKNSAKNAEGAKANFDKLFPKNETYGDMVDRWLAESQNIPVAIESLNSLKEKLKELKEEQAAAPLEMYHSYDADIKALEDQIALYEKSGDAAKKMAKDTDDAYKLMRKAAEDFSKAVKLKPIFDTSQQGEQVKEIELFGKKVQIQFDKNIGAWQIMKDEEEKAQIEMRDNFKQFNEDRLKEQQDAAAKFQQFSDDHPLAAALGFEDEEQLNQVKDYADQIMSFINDMVNQQVEARTRLVEDWNQKIDEQQELVNRENEDRAQGLANNYEIEQQNLANMQKARDQAIKDREKSIKLQRTLSTVESSIALISAAANIIKGFSSIPVIGWILGIAAVGAMIAGFIAAQGKVNDSIQMEEGGQAHGLLKGKRHSQGGIPIEAEDGEWFINRNSSKKYSPLLDAINRDDQQGMKLFFDRKFLTKMPKQNFSFDIDKSKKLDEIARNTRKKGGETIIGPGYILERYGGYTKKINLN